MFRKLFMINMILYVELKVIYFRNINPEIFDSQRRPPFYDHIHLALI